MRSGHFPPQRKKKNPFDICIVGLLLFCGEEVDVGLWFELESLFPVFSLLVKFLEGRERNGGGKRNFGVAVVGSEAEEEEEIFPGKHPIFPLPPLSNTHTHSLPILCAAARGEKGKNKCLPPRFSGSPSFSLLIASAAAAQSWHCRVWERDGRLFSCFRVQFLGACRSCEVPKRKEGSSEAKL